MYILEKIFNFWLALKDVSRERIKFKSSRCFDARTFSSIYVSMFQRCGFSSSIRSFICSSPIWSVMQESDNLPP